MSGNEKPGGKSGTCARCTDLERQLADERARIDCSTRGGWLSEDLECAGEDGPACWKHLLAEATRKLDAVRQFNEDKPHEEIADNVCASFCKRCALDRILKGE